MGRWGSLWLSLGSCLALSELLGGFAPFRQLGWGRLLQELFADSNHAIDEDSVCLSRYAVTVVRRKTFKAFHIFLAFLASSLRSLGVAQVQATMQLLLWLPRHRAMLWKLGTTAFDVNKRPAMFSGVRFQKLDERCEMLFFSLST